MRDDESGALGGGAGACGFAVDLVPAGARQVRAIFECEDGAERAPLAGHLLFL